jgi:hypothetical protein
VRRGTISVLLTALTLVAAGCGDGDAETATPAACLGGSDAFVKALAGPPDEVLVGGTTPIADCLPEEQSGGQLANVGEAIVAAATELNEEARRAPQGDAPLQLGYLVGTVQTAAEGTGGIHADLARRVESAARFVPKGEPVAAAFQQRYAEGLAAGTETG